LAYEGLPNGRYSAWARAVNSQGVNSENSDKISFLVTSPIFIKIGSLAINYFTIFILLLLFVILVIAFFAYWAGLIRGKLRKETGEAEKALHGNLKNFKKLIEKEVTQLSKTKGKRGKGTKKTLKNRIDFIEKKILKEIDDIQVLLK